MKIKNAEQLHAFESAIDQCSHSVWLESDQGERYNLKDALDRYRGIGQLLSDTDENLMLFTSIREDTAIMLDFCNKLTA